MGQAGPGVSACSVAAYSNPHDASPTNLRAAPHADAKVIGQLPGLKGGPDTEAAEPEFEIIGSKDGWPLIRTPRTAGPAWIWGGLAGVQLADYALRSAPRADAPVVAPLRNSQKGWAPDSFGVRTIHGCTGTWVEVTAAPPEGRELRGWVGHTCRSQLTTCDMGGIPQPPSFDCAKARSPAERMVCADPDLSSLDQSLSEVFEAALNVVPRQAALRVEQQHWLTDRRDKAADAGILGKVYQSRIGELQAAADDGVRIRALTTSADGLAEHCVPLQQERDEICHVEERGPLEGGLFYQLQAYFAGTLRTDGGIAILAAGPRTNSCDRRCGTSRTPHTSPNPDGSPRPMASCSNSADRSRAPAISRPAASSARGTASGERSTLRPGRRPRGASAQRTNRAQGHLSQLDRDDRRYVAMARKATPNAALPAAPPTRR